MNGTTTILDQVAYEPFGPARSWVWGITAKADLDDANGNRLSQTGTSASTFTVSTVSNQLNSVSGALARTYTYDGAGNVDSDGTFVFSYAGSGRMASVTDGSTTTAYTYNALGERVAKTDGTNPVHFVYDEAGHLLGQYDGAGDLIEEIVWMGDIPVASIRPNGGSVGIFYIHTDQLNTPRKLTRPSDNVIVWRWDSTPFGVGNPDQDPDGNSQYVVFNPRFPGQYYDSETGLNYNYFRDYDPATGRYVQSDPIGLAGGSLSPYAYVGGAPVIRSDPTGLSPLVDLSKVLDWISPKPMSAQACRGLRDDIYRKNRALQEELGAYDPIQDGLGGFAMRYGSGVTKPGGHYLEIRDLQRGLKRDLKTYNQRCRCDKNDDGNPPITRNVDELANKAVPRPVVPFSIYAIPGVGTPGMAPVRGVPIFEPVPIFAIP